MHETRQSETQLQLSQYAAFPLRGDPTRVGIPLYWGTDATFFTSLHIPRPEVS